MPMFYDADADLDLLSGKTVAVIGYGSQGHAHALNLRDSGVGVVVGLRPGSSSTEAAREEGLEVLPPREAAERCDMVMILAPDEHQGRIFAEEIAPGLGEGDALLFAHGFSIHFGQVVPPPGVDVMMVAPKGPGHLVRRTYAEGAGTPGLMAVQQDASGGAKGLALAYAKGSMGQDIGSVANFCDRAHNGEIAQHANTMYKQGFVVAGPAIALHAQRRTNAEPGVEQVI